MPPASQLGAELPETVLLLRVSVPSLEMPLQPVLPETVLLMRVSVPSLVIKLFSAIWLSLKVRPEMVTECPESM